MKREEKKRLAIAGFMNDLWTACAEGSKFKFTEGRTKHRVSDEYVYFIKRNCVEQTEEPSVYRVKKGVNKDATVQMLASKNIKELGVLLNRAPKNVKKAAPAVSAPVQHLQQVSQHVAKKLKHLSPTDTILSVTKLGEPEVVTKQEVAQTVKQVVETTPREVDDLSGRNLKDCTVTIKVTRQHPGGVDSTSFVVKENMSYLNVVSEVNKFKQ